MHNMHGDTGKTMVATPPQLLTPPISEISIFYFFIFYLFPLCLVGSAFEFVTISSREATHAIVTRDPVFSRGADRRNGTRTRSQPEQNRFPPPTRHFSPLACPTHTHTHTLFASARVLPRQSTAAAAAANQISGREGERERGEAVAALRNPKIYCCH